MKLFFNKFYLYIVCIFITGCKEHNTSKEEIAVFCAAGLYNVFTEISESFKNDRSITFNINLASSGTLARQIEQGIHPDIYISANMQWADYVDSLNICSLRKNLYKNTLVLIAPTNSTIKTISLTKHMDIASMFNGYIAMGDPAYVPAGKYAVESFKSLHIYNKIESQILPTKDVNSTLMLVEMEECELGVVYKSGAIKSDKVKIVGIFPEDIHEPIIFQALLLRDAGISAKMFYDFLTDSATFNIWTENGFSIIP
ncbi:MAG: molybdate ABC transporter substrate-binding protein [Bacteroidales bacterium]|nr:molybdate ABC transporter substrate-binding protein [Bacteroidales bacterium]